MNRTQAREWLVKLLYQFDVSKSEPSDILNKFFENNDPEEEKDYIEKTFYGIVENVNNIDDRIKKYLKNWDINRIAKIDLAIMRCSFYEILYCDDIPNSVSINEAVEIAKKYSTEKSPSFINGILGSLVKDFNMMVIIMIIDGKVIAKRIRANIKAEIQENNYKPKLAILIAGNDSASKIYANAKVKACAGVGIDAEVFCFSDSEEGKFLNKLEELNVDENIHGIFVEMPLPKSFNSQRTYDIINPLKDVDCISTYNMGRLFAGNPLYLPCTPHAILTILKQLDINFTGKHAVIVGRSNILGKPVAKLMLDLDMTVTQCHSKTVDLQKYTKMADVLILAAGKKNLINGDMIKEGVILIDAGINEYDGKIYGDCDFQSAENRCLYITPVPGGVGPVTTSMVLLNTLEAYKNAIKNTYSKTSQ